MLWHRLYRLRNRDSTRAINVVQNGVEPVHKLLTYTFDSILPLHKLIHNPLTMGIMLLETTL